MALHPDERDTYIRRDPVSTFGKFGAYNKPPPPTISRFGQSGSTLSRDRHTGYVGFVPGQRDVTGCSIYGRGEEGEDVQSMESDSPAITTPPFPLKVGKYTTMKELTLDRMVLAGDRPGHLCHIQGYQGHKPTHPVAEEVEQVMTWQKQTSLFQQAEPQSS
mmetsp:Transcript_16045/g.34841  ORF Transcript_16045/g.34841 Transcript_16045/m.34841 type:complete len:161 (-) Transcript_16045:159-641(-)|eukprot:CAMPEP_0183356802 /NCGR_PEP_ID=MMETSP0164_2-20130417/45202_1 /TAXON_ID=221442 /ORGANISM="Coccolithus pelagicus ssp braarudi, Strain PLY182g" /LENGTH=160 /DNA_ID=CAMNT_0025530301 /DNA_START=27 /DNA_END=509 /DNA_ORIENTATION=+